jgi:hypothetical protein
MCSVGYVDERTVLTDELHRLDTNLVHLHQKYTPSTALITYLQRVDRVNTGYSSLDFVLPTQRSTDAHFFSAMFIDIPIMKHIDGITDAPPPPPPPTSSNDFPEDASIAALEGVLPLIQSFQLFFDKTIVEEHPTPWLIQELTTHSSPDDQLRHRHGLLPQLVEHYRRDDFVDPDSGALVDVYTYRVPLQFFMCKHFAYAFPAFLCRRTGIRIHVNFHLPLPAGTGIDWQNCALYMESVLVPEPELARLRSLSAHNLGDGTFTHLIHTTRVQPGTVSLEPVSYRDATRVNTRPVRIPLLLTDLGRISSIHLIAETMREPGRRDADVRWSAVLNYRNRVLTMAENQTHASSLLWNTYHRQQYANDSHVRNQVLLSWHLSLADGTVNDAVAQPLGHVALDAFQDHYLDVLVISNDPAPRRFVLLYKSWAMLAFYPDGSQQVGRLW